MKVAELQIRSANKEVLKQISTIYLPRQHWISVVPHISTLVISCPNYSKKYGIVLKFINKVKYRHVIGLLTTCGYQHCGGKKGFNVRSMLAQSYSTLPVLHNILRHFFHEDYIILSTCLYYKQIWYKKKGMTMINISV